MILSTADLNSTIYRLGSTLCTRDFQAAASTDASSLVVSLETNTATNFDIAAGTNVISIKSTADLDFEAGASVQVLVE